MKLKVGLLIILTIDLIALWVLCYHADWIVGGIK